MNFEPDGLDEQAGASGTTIFWGQIDVVHPAGLKHQAADVLLRQKTYGENKNAMKDDIEVLYLTSPSTFKKNRQMSFMTMTESILVFVLCYMLFTQRRWEQSLGMMDTQYQQKKL